MDGTACFCATDRDKHKLGGQQQTHAANTGGRVCLRVLAAIGLAPVRPGGSFAGASRRPQEKGNVGIRKSNWPDRWFGKRRFLSRRLSQRGSACPAAAPPSRTQ
jgi:hypothetical protein